MKCSFNKPNSERISHLSLLNLKTNYYAFKLIVEVPTDQLNQQRPADGTKDHNKQSLNLTMDIGIPLHSTWPTSIL